MSRQALSISVTHADGRITRWSGEEASPEYVPMGLSFGTSIPGGFKDLTVTLPRSITTDYPDLNLYDDLRVYGPGNATVWEGRVVQLPRSHGDDATVTVGAVGWAAHLRDDQTFREIYVDMDLSQWGQPPALRRQNLVVGQLGPQDHIIQNEDGRSVLVTNVKGPWAAASRAICEPWYDGLGINIGVFQGAWKVLGSSSQNLQVTDANWTWQAITAQDPAFTNITATGNLRSAGPNTFQVVQPLIRFYALVQLWYATGPAGGNNTDYAIAWTALAVFGSHGLPQRGTLTATTTQGLYASDVIPHVLGKAAPKIVVDPALIEPTTLVIPQLTFKEPTTAEDVVSKVNAYHLYEWGVYDDRKFFFRAPDEDRCQWEARLADGARLELEGVQSDDTFNGVAVSFRSATGDARVIVPTGGVGNASSDLLLDANPDNPLNVRGIRRWAKLDLSNPTTDQGAIAIGAAWIAEQNRPTRRGSLTMTGTMKHPTKGERPVYEIRAGDFVRISDHPADVPRRIVETRYDDTSKTATLTLDSSAHRLDAVLERLGLALTNFGG